MPIEKLVSPASARFPGTDSLKGFALIDSGQADAGHIRQRYPRRRKSDSLLSVVFCSLEQRQDRFNRILLGRTICKSTNRQYVEANETDFPGTPPSERRRTYQDRRRSNVPRIFRHRRGCSRDYQRPNRFLQRDC
jgi:hypothetical protein